MAVRSLSAPLFVCYTMTRIFTTHNYHNPYLPLCFRRKYRESSRKGKMLNLYYYSSMKKYFSQNRIKIWRFREKYLPLHRI